MRARLWSRRRDHLSLSLSLFLSLSHFLPFPLSLFFPSGISAGSCTLTDDELCLSGKINELLIIAAGEPSLPLGGHFFVPWRCVYLGLR